MVFLLLTACHLQLVAPYNSQFVADAVTVQTDFDVLVQTLLEPPTSSSSEYGANKIAYNKLNADLIGWLTRAKAYPHNEPSVESINKLTLEIYRMETNHKNHGHVSPSYLEDKQAIIDQQIGILIRTETDKKALTF